MVMEQIDESKRKPRRTRGTPSFYYRNRFAYGVIAAGTVLFAIWAWTPMFQITNEKICKAVLKPTEEELERRALFTFPAARTSQSIKDTIEDKKRVMSDR